MKNILFTPVISSNVNGLADPLLTAQLAYNYDEVVLKYPTVYYSPRSVDGFDIDNSDSVRQTNHILQMIGKPCWICINALWPNFNKTFTASAYNLAIAASVREIQEFWLHLPESYRKYVKGFALDHSDYSRMFGLNFNVSPEITSYYNRLYTNTLIQAAHSYNLPAMVITDRASDIVGKVYRSVDTSIPGAAKWPSLLGGDSDLGDWLVVRDPFYTPANILSYMINPAEYTAYSDVTEYYLSSDNVILSSETELQGNLVFPGTYSLENEQDFVVGPSPHFLFNGMGSTFWRLFENYPILQTYRKDNLSVGFLQHLDFSANVSDTSTSPNLTSSQRTMITNMFTFLGLLGIDGAGVISLSSVPYVNNVDIFTPLAYQELAASAPAIPHSANGLIFADFLYTSLPSRVTVSQDFQNFHLYQLTGS